ncbi:MAG: hypothetical protein EAZ83_16400 [Oscillatoriales cyanobacterium]|nr:MAG: hypothetical protein EAZ83_16400 [Oscillatoriales cyanobacterium]
MALSSVPNIQFKCATESKTGNWEESKTGNWEESKTGNWELGRKQNRELRLTSLTLFCARASVQ